MAMSYFLIYVIAKDRNSRANTQIIKHKNNKLTKPNYIRIDGI